MRALRGAIARALQALGLLRSRLKAAEAEVKAAQLRRPLPILGVDYAWHDAGRPTPAGLHSHGVGFVCRYLTEPGKQPGEGKTLGRPEAVALSRAGLDIVAIFEEGGEAARGGESAGARDGLRALHAAQRLGVPRGRPIYFAADFDARGPAVEAVLAYLRGAKRAMGGYYHAGLYGGLVPVRAALNAGFHYGWQTLAWSEGVWDARAQIRQTSTAGPVIDGVDCDTDWAHAADYGQWRL